MKINGQSDDSVHFVPGIINGKYVSLRFLRSQTSPPSDPLNVTVSLLIVFQCFATNRPVMLKLFAQKSDPTLYTIKGTFMFS